MSKTGPKIKPEWLKIVAGTDRPDRTTTEIYDEIDLPVSLPAAFEDLKEEKPKTAAKILALWNERLRVYELRGQPVAGYEYMLYQLCCVDVEINEMRANGTTPPASLITQLRGLAADFYDLPSANVRTGGSAKENPFKRNGKPRGA